MNCPVGYEPYKNICVPSYFSAAERERAYQEAQAAKRPSVIGYVIIGVVVVAALASFTLLL